MKSNLHETSRMQRVVAATILALFLPMSAAQSVPYKVESGDTLEGIAKKFDTRVAVLLQANPQIVNPDLIYPGERLVVPNLQAPDVSEKAEIHPIRMGETLGSIAASHGSTVQELAAINRIPNPDRIEATRLLRLGWSKLPDNAELRIGPDGSMRVYFKPGIEPNHSEALTADASATTPAARAEQLKSSREALARWLERDDLRGLRESLEALVGDRVDKAEDLAERSKLRRAVPLSYYWSPIRESAARDSQLESELTSRILQRYGYDSRIYRPYEPTYRPYEPTYRPYEPTYRPYRPPIRPRFIPRPIR